MKQGPICWHAGSPGDSRRVVAVGSVNEDDEISKFSGLGPAFHGGLKPDMVGKNNLLKPQTLIMYTLGYFHWYLPRVSIIQLQASESGLAGTVTTRITVSWVGRLWVYLITQVFISWPYNFYILCAARFTSITYRSRYIFYFINLVYPT